MAFLKAEWKILGLFCCHRCHCSWDLWAAEANLHTGRSQLLLLLVLSLVHCRFYWDEGATKANVRTAHAARSSLSKALSVSFTGGSVMGLGVAGLAVLGLGGVFIVLIKIFAPGAISTSHEVCKSN